MASLSESSGATPTRRRAQVRHDDASEGAPAPPPSPTVRVRRRTRNVLVVLALVWWLACMAWFIQRGGARAAVHVYADSVHRMYQIIFVDFWPL